MVNVFGLSFDVGSITGGIFNVLLLVIVLVLAIVLIVFFVFIRKFKHKFRIREVINGRKIIRDEKAREVKSDDGVIYWQLLNSRVYVEIPPSEAIDVDFKGRKCVEAYRVETGEFVWAVDNAQMKEPPADLFSKPPKDVLKIEEEVVREQGLKEWRQKVLKEWQKKNNIIAAFQPLTTKQRLIYINQIKKAYARRTKPWQEYILPIVGIGALVILVVSLMIFWGDLAQPLLDMKNKQIQQDQIQQETLQIIKEIKNDIQVLDSQSGGGRPSEPPN